MKAPGPPGFSLQAGCRWELLPGAPLLYKLCTQTTGAQVQIEAAWCKLAATSWPVSSGSEGPVPQATVASVPSSTSLNPFLTSSCGRLCCSSCRIPDYEQTVASASLLQDHCCLTAPLKIHRSF